MRPAPWFFRPGIIEAFMFQRRIVVTGIGAVTPLGNDIETSFSAMLEGKSGVTAISSFDASKHDARIAGTVKNFELSPQIADKKEARRMDFFVQYAMASADMAIKDAGLDLGKVNLERFG